MYNICMNKTEYLEYCNQKYAEGNPILPDEVYDRLIANTQLESKVGYIEVGEQRFNHPFPMYSLQKVFVGEDEEPIWDSIQPHIMTPKLDGCAVSITYIDGELSQALTRGDGKEGLDITDKIRFLVPKHIFRTQLTQITGEIVAPKTIPNARNYASGALNLKDIEEFKSRDLTFIAYGVQPSICSNWTEDLLMINNSGFQTITQSDYSQFPQDGKVVRVDSNKYFESLGYTAHHPRGSFALKTRQAGVVTRLLDVEWNVGKSGAVSPVAILEPCVIGEATISRATLHNIAYIEALDLEIGCNVEVIRSGEIIPRIVRRV
jgi:NAD-dependent DNA ligase